MQKCIFFICQQCEAVFRVREIFFFFFFNYSLCAVNSASFLTFHKANVLWGAACMGSVASSRGMAESRHTWIQYWTQCRYSRCRRHGAILSSVEEVSGVRVCHWFSFAVAELLGKVQTVVFTQLCAASPSDLSEMLTLLTDG